MINILDLLYICLAISSLVFAGFFAYMAINIASAVKVIKQTAENIEYTTDNVKENLTDITQGLKYGVMGIVAKLIGTKGGEHYSTR